MDPLDIPTLAAYADGLLRGHSPGTLVQEISTDSRTIQPGDLFLALRGERFDGHDHLAQVVDRGAVGAIVDHEFLKSTAFSMASVPENFVWIVTPDTLLAYQRIALQYRLHQLANLQVIGITGSNGKTSTKDFTAAVLARRFSVLKTEGNLNNHVGVPRMVLRASGSVHEVAVLEMGMNHPGEIAPLTRITRPDVGIITNIGTAHLEFMRSRAAIADEKGMLAEALGREGTLILPAQDEFTPSLAARTSAATVLTVGIDQGDLQATAIEIDPQTGGSRFTVREAGQGQRTEVVLATPGEHMVTNALLAIAAGRALGMTLEECAGGLAEVRLTRGRLERKKLGGLDFLDDTYNANPDSMTAALRTLARLPVSQQGRRMAVLGRMGELGEAAAAGYQQVGDSVATAGVDVLVTVGPEAEAIAAAARARGFFTTHAVHTTTEASEWLLSSARPADLILLKGSRSAAMETVLKPFETHSAEPAAARPGR